MLAEKRRRRADWELLSELGPTCSTDDASLELPGRSRENCCRQEVRLPLGELPSIGQLCTKLSLSELLNFELSGRHT